MKINEVYSNITEQIKNRLEQGTLPWRKSWIIGLPQNITTRRPYSGVNFLSLCMADFASPYYLTYLQCKDRGGYITKGSKGIPILFWTLLSFGLPDNHEKQKPYEFPYLKYSYVYNLTQTSLYSGKPEPTSIIGCEQILNDMKERPVIKHNTLRCYYSPTEDYISVPMPEDFDSTEEYYSSLFHELIHWTGSRERLARLDNRSDEAEVANEELIAEIGSSFLCGLCGISSAVIDNQAAYIEGWLSHLNNDAAYFIKAATAANKAVNYILGNQI